MYGYIFVFVAVAVLTLVAFLSVRPYTKKNIFKDVERSRACSAEDMDLSRGFTMAKVPADLDAVVIGSGLGGLYSAALLSLAGKKVLVLEQHDRAGGATHGFTADGKYDFDIGVHYVCAVKDGGMVADICDACSEGRLVMDQMDPEFDIVRFENDNIEMAYTPQTILQSLLEKFPEDEAGIRHIFKLIDKSQPLVTAQINISILARFPSNMYRGLAWLGRLFAPRILSMWYPELHQSLQTVLDKHIKSPVLKAYFAYASGNYSLAPSKIGMMYYATMFRYYWDCGASYPRGGTTQFAKTVLPTIRKRGGEVLVGANVTSIIESNGQVTGVMVKKKHVINAPIVISSVGYNRTLTKILTPSPDLEIRSCGDGYFFLFLGFDKSPDELNLKASNYWIYPDYNVEECYSCPDFEDAIENHSIMFITFPCAKDSTWKDRHPNHTTCEVLTLMRSEWMDEYRDTKIKHRGVEYEDMKERMEQKLIVRLMRHFPQLEGHIDYVGTGSLLTQEHYLGSWEGSGMGLNHTIDRFSRGYNSFATDYDGLYVCGQDTICSGVGGAVASALAVSSAIMNRDLEVDIAAAYPTKLDFFVSDTPPVERSQGYHSV